MVIRVLIGVGEDKGRDTCLMTMRTIMKVQQSRKRIKRETSNFFSSPLRPCHRLVDLILYFRLGDTNIVLEELYVNYRKVYLDALEAVIYRFQTSFVQF